MSNAKPSWLHQLVAAAIILAAVLFAFRFIDATGFEVMLIAVLAVAAYFVGARFLFGKRIG